MRKFSNALLAASLGVASLQIGDKTVKSYTTRTGQGRKRTTTAAQQKRDKIKRNNKGK